VDSSAIEQRKEGQKEQEKEMCKQNKLQHFHLKV
jgi:hypothetical protein